MSSATSGTCGMTQNALALKDEDDNMKDSPMSTCML